MKKNKISILLCFGLALVLAGCGEQALTEASVEAQASSNTESSISETSRETSVEETTQAETVQPLAETVWSMDYETTHDFKVYFSAFNTKDLGLAVGYSGEIHTSTDGGATWPESVNESACMYSLDFVDDNIMYACGNCGDVTKSTDGGKNFAMVSVFMEESPVKLYDICFIDENNGIVAAQERMGITSDGGVTWTEVQQSNLIAGILMTSPQEFYYIGSDYCLYKTMDSGSTWEKTPLNLPLEKDYTSSSQNYAIYKDGENAFTLYCTQKSTKLLKSYSTTDNCATWTENAMPEVEGHTSLYLNKAGNVLSLHNVSKESVKVLTK